MGIEVVLRLTAMGDVLLAVPAVHALQFGKGSSRPLSTGEVNSPVSIPACGADAPHIGKGSSRLLHDAPLPIGGRNQIHWVLDRRWRELQPFLPAKVSFYAGISSLFPLARRLRALHPERVHDLQGKFHTVLLSRLIGAPTTRYQKRSLQETFSVMQGDYPLRFSDSRPVWEKYLECIGKSPKDQPIDALIQIPSELEMKSRRFLENQNQSPFSYYLFHPGASKPGKVFPQAGLEAVLGGLSKRVILIGDDDRPLYGTSLIDWRNRLPLDVLPGIMKFSAGVISTDSGPMHLARAVGTPIAAFFFQTDPSLGFAPIPGPRVKIFSRDLPCKPCSIHGQRGTCPEGHWNCRLLDWPLVARETRDFLEAS